MFNDCPVLEIVIQSTSSMRANSYPVWPAASFSLPQHDLEPRCPPFIPRHRIPERFGLQPHTNSPEIFQILSLCVSKGMSL